MSKVHSRPVVQVIEQLQQSGGLKGTDIANFDGVSRATVSRWTGGKKSPHPKTRLIISDLASLGLRGQAPRRILFQ